MEKEKERGKQEAKMALLVASAASNAKARAKEDLTRVQEALAAAEEGRHKAEENQAKVQEALAAVEESRRKAEAETTRLEVEWTSLLLELGAINDEVSSLHSQAGRDKEAMEEEYHKALEVIFAYRYGCYVFKHNIYGDHPEVLDGMPDSADPLYPEVFMNPKCPFVQADAKNTSIEVHLSKAAKEPMEVAVAEDQSRL